MPEEFKLSYFPLGIRAEPIRMTFALSGTKYEDERISMEEWGARKADFPTGQLPHLLWNGHSMSESLAILRFVGKKCGMYPEDAFEAWQCDQVIDFLNDFVVKLCSPLLFKKDFGEENQKFYGEYTEKIVKFLGKMHKENGKKHICHDKATIADSMAAFFIFAFFHNENHPGGAVFTDIAKAHAEKNEDFQKYVEVARETFGDYVKNRGPIPL